MEACGIGVRRRIGRRHRMVGPAHEIEGIPSVKQAVAGRLMPIWQTVAHVLLQIFIVGTGLSVAERWRRANSVPCSRSDAHACCG